MTRGEGVNESRHALWSKSVSYRTCKKKLKKQTRGEGVNESRHALCVCVCVCITHTHTHTHAHTHTMRLQRYLN
jgi:hypothetical protein